MFFRRNLVEDLKDLTTTLRDPPPWATQTLQRNLGIRGDIVSVANEPLSGLLALGTSLGVIHLFGSLAASSEISIPGAPYRKSRFIGFAQAVHKMVVVGM